MRPWLYKFDSALISAVQSGPQWLYGPMLFITNVGQPAAMVGAALVFFIIALTQNNTRLLIASAIVPITVGLTSVMKLALQRVRPETEYVQNMFFASFSFPSGHAAGAMIGCGFLAYIAWNSLPQPWALIVATVFALFILAVGVSRIYLGAHYPSDVIGGWLVGAAALCVIVFIIKPTLQV